MNVLRLFDYYLQDLARNLLIDLLGGSILGGLPTYRLADGLYLLIKTITLAYGAAYTALKAPGWISDKAKVKEMLVRAFIEAGVYVEKQRKDWGDGKMKPYRVFPTIERVAIAANCTTINLRLPIGMEPDLIERKAWVFQSVFGATAELVNDRAGRFRILIPKPLSAKIPYSLETAQAALQRAGGFALYVGEAYNGSVAVDLKQAPHVGLVGVTGWGKSTALRVILNTWLQTYGPDRLRLFLGDLKMTEFGLYRGAPHVEGAIAVRRAEVVAMLAEVHEVLLYRQEMFHQAGAVDLDEYEELTGECLPYVVVCIDEVASLEGEAAAHDILEEIGQLGRSFGIFLVLSQQRVDREVMDGKLKNNLNVRIAYRMSDDMNSKMFLGTSAAAGIDTKGRCYVKRATETVEVQTPWLSPKEARAQVEEIKRRYAGAAKAPLLPPINPSVPQPVEANDQESAELRELLNALMQEEVPPHASA
ncbi:FtsK/SpoIIIE domain-containing protein [Brevibacillus borstelensis]|uniref:FtsK/SpoIIIE domain-containing protein n=1 Tax=Brevibacillus borstelensis TaxID=45462 RepID=UPI002E1D77F9|nr:FtsK/SpoIIIE domain-containing protein [Brevibacillus borstelensis]MED1850372.1 FtsK/SpoIIIE domain-containing protein [Brevibacillus borstelensis]